MAHSTFASALSGSSGSNSQPHHRPVDWGRRAGSNGLSVAAPPASSGTVPNSGVSLGRQQASSQQPFNSRRDDSRFGSSITPNVPSSFQSSAGPAGRSSDGGAAVVYTRQEMLALFETQSREGRLDADLDRLYMKGWDPENFPDGASPLNWTNNSHGFDSHSKSVAAGADVCWDPSGSNTPLGLVELSETEKELFSSSVNSTHKIASQTKDPGSKDPLSHRKGSILNPHQPILSPSSGRPPNRRRDGTDQRQSFSSPSNGVGHRIGRDDYNPPLPPASLLRRRTETRDAGLNSTPGDSKGVDNLVDGSDPGKLFQSIKRSTPGVSNSPGPWASSAGAAFSPMGQFGSSDASPSPASKTRPGFGTLRNQSRFKGLMGQDSDEVEERPRKTEEEKTLAWGSLRGNRANANNPPGSFERVDAGPSGSAALLDGSSIEEPIPAVEGGSAPFGSGPINQPVFQGQNDESSVGPTEPVSPDSSTNTNPYQSPGQEQGAGRAATGQDGPGGSANLANLGHDAGSLPGLGSLSGLGSSTFEFGGNDRARPGPSGLPGLAGLVGAGQSASMWGPSSGIGTPTGERQGPFGGAFTDGMFSTVSDFPASMLPGLGSGGPFGSTGGGFLGGTSTPGGSSHTSKLGSLFPLSMQEQMRARAQQSQPSAMHSRPDDNGDIGPVGYGLGGRPVFGSTDALRSMAGMDDGLVMDGRTGDLIGPQGDLSNASSSQIGPNLGASQLAPQRTMVMPDRMLWIYKDPQGKIQGPWSGLEMHDWYKAGFFTPELLVKKTEDIDFEPLANLIRRIGNTREPFLVPQVGIPHGPPSGQGNAWASGPMGGAVPPFANSFPSFGTTLTAEQQNALERRKQEEQYFSARQKEHLAQQQLAKQMMQSQTRLLSHQMHPSIHPPNHFGGLGSHSGFHTPQVIPSGSQVGGGYFDPSFGLNAGAMTELPTDMVSHLSLADPGQSTFSDQSALHAQAVSALLNQRELLQEEQAQHDASVNDALAASETLERFQQFHHLRVGDLAAGAAGETDVGLAELAEAGVLDYSESKADESLLLSDDGGVPVGEDPADMEDDFENGHSEELEESISAHDALGDYLLEGQLARPSPWAKVDVGQVHSMAELALEQTAESLDRSAIQHAAVDQRVQAVAEASRTPDTPTAASLAPWARDVVETAKGPSLKEIQEAEARKAAEREEVAAIARRAALEREAIAAAMAASNVPAAPGLPASSNWASGGAKPASPAPWSRPVAAKVDVPSSNKKTLQQIQQEEEARKQRVAAASPAVVAPKAAVVVKRYADLGSQQPPASTSAGAWTTVGSSGKAKRSPVMAAAAVVRPSVSTQPVAMGKPKAVIRPTAITGATKPENAIEEVRKWSVGELRRDLNKGINVDEFVQGLMSFPCELDVITEAVHAVSMTMDSRRFADQFIRLRKLADKGIFDGSTTASPSTSKQPDGWSEVARRGQVHQINKEEQQQQQANSFRLVAPKKRGKR